MYKLTKKQEEIYLYCKPKWQVKLWDIQKELWIDHPQKVAYVLETLEKKWYAKKIGVWLYDIYEKQIDFAEEFKRLKEVENKYEKLTEHLQSILPQLLEVNYVRSKEPYASRVIAPTIVGNSSCFWLLSRQP